MKEDKYVVTLVSEEGKNGVADSSVFDKIIGQEEASRKLSFYIKSHSTETPFPTLLFTGSQGLGKTYFAQKVANSLGRKLVEINCGSLEKRKDFIEGVLFEKVLGNECITLLLDESHKLPTPITTLLLSLLNPTESYCNKLTYKNWVIEYDFSKINVIFATTDAHSMFRPLVNRCEEVYFNIYSNQELYKMLKFYLPDVSIKCNQKDLSYACRGRGRDAFVLSQNIKRYCIMNHTKVLTEEGWKELKSIFSIHLKGLNAQELGLLRVLEDSSPISCNNIAVRMGVNPQNVESELEIRPRELGLIESGTRGRSLTEDGEIYLSLVGASC